MAVYFVCEPPLTLNYLWGVCGVFQGDDYDDDGCDDNDDIEDNVLLKISSE